MALAGVLIAAPAMADTIEFNWVSAGSPGGNPEVPDGAGSFGNALTLTVGGVKVTASAWGYTYGSSNNAFQSAALGAYNHGLGVCNREEDTYYGNPPTCGSPSHAVSNTDPSLTNGDDFVLFTFSLPDGTPLAVDPTSVTLDTFGMTYDRDTSYWLGNVSSSFSLAGKSYSDLAGLFGPRVDNENGNSPSGGPYTTSVPIAPTGGPFYNALLFGARIEPDGGEDYFKISKLTINTMPPPSVPEPVSLVLVGLGMAGVHTYRRRAAFARR
jgi:hypothetical protein